MYLNLSYLRVVQEYENSAQQSSKAWWTNICGKYIRILFKINDRRQCTVIQLPDIEKEKTSANAGSATT